MYRRNLGHSRVKNLFRFASPKMNSVLTVESSLEFDACFHFEYSPKIEHFEAQPQGFYYPFNGRDCGYTPDFAVVENGVRRFIEVKPQRKTLNSDFRSRFHAKQIKAKELGSSLVLVTDKQICVNPILSNLKLLHRYSGFQAMTPLHLYLLKLVKCIGVVSVAELIEESGEEPGSVLATTLSLVAGGEITTDLLNSTLGLDTRVWC
ncbi:TnsA endonuclease N-terminal domain-containing protein [Ferrimonas lipolytica]|uniref:Endonuclease n=1 Tax=Ferrimonas lipolytica TaxID=2724191 RepID=A0A6H1UC15_9GAMM|nr:TnsA endonuclease N-terminal domain-containing protein [Ferrimonas lipolytica]QIZ75746.1 endonuclease [Ferrimonas lipolytica]